MGPVVLHTEALPKDATRPHAKAYLPRRDVDVHSGPATPWAATEGSTRRAKEPRPSCGWGPRCMVLDVNAVDRTTALGPTSWGRTAGGRRGQRSRRRRRWRAGARRGGPPPVPRKGGWGGGGGRAATPRRPRRRRCRRGGRIAATIFSAVRRCRLCRRRCRALHRGGGRDDGRGGSDGSGRGGSDNSGGGGGGGGGRRATPSPSLRGAAAGAATSMARTHPHPPPWLYSTRRRWGWGEATSCQSLNDR